MMQLLFPEFLFNKTWQKFESNEKFTNICNLSKPSLYLPSKLQIYTLQKKNVCRCSLKILPKIPLYIGITD